MFSLHIQTFISTKRSITLALDQTKQILFYNQNNFMYKDKNNHHNTTGTENTIPITTKILLQKLVYQ